MNPLSYMRYIEWVPAKRAQVTLSNGHVPKEYAKYFPDVCEEVNREN